jgi:peptidoglycan/LPS O-acetylase OafA/YrhL
LRLSLPVFFDWEWVKAGSFVMLAPARLPVYAGMFILGIYGYKNRWFINKIPGSPWKWCVLSVFLSVLLLGCSKVIWETRDNTFAISLAHGFLRSFAALSWFCFFLNLSKKYMNKTSTFLKFIHKHSYETYLLHLPIVIVLQLVLLKSSLPVGIKFILVSIGSIALTLVFSSVFYKRVQLFFENFSFTESEKELCRSGAKG